MQGCLLLAHAVLACTWLLVAFWMQSDLPDRATPWQSVWQCWNVKCSEASPAEVATCVQVLLLCIRLMLGLEHLVLLECCMPCCTMCGA